MTRRKHSHPLDDQASLLCVSSFVIPFYPADISSWNQLRNQVRHENKVLTTCVPYQDNHRKQAQNLLAADLVAGIMDTISSTPATGFPRRAQYSGPYQAQAQQPLSEAGMPGLVLPTRPERKRSRSPRKGLDVLDDRNVVTRPNERGKMKVNHANPCDSK